MTTEPLQLDGITFAAEGAGEAARDRDGRLVGQLWPDAEHAGWWMVSKIVRGEWCEAKPARSPAEARAFICSKVWE
jgi:hypothetical protein